MGQNGSTAGPDGDVGRAFGLGPVGKDRVLFFSEFIFNAKTIPEKSRITQKILKIP
jgi:hypothetical protein